MAEPSTPRATEGGEHPNGRLAMERLEKRLVNEGVRPERAEQIARETARRMDRKDYGRAG